MAWHPRPVERLTPSTAPRLARWRPDGAGAIALAACGVTAAHVLFGVLTGC